MIRSILRFFGLVRFELDDIKSNNILKCARCSVELTEENNSGWEEFESENKL